MTASSPIAAISRARTPMLIQHGAKDQRVPISNAMELYPGLRERGVPVELFVYPEFEHPITKPRENHAIAHQNLSWFRHWLLDEGSSWNHRPEDLMVRGTQSRQTDRWPGRPACRSLGGGCRPSGAATAASAEAPVGTGVDSGSVASRASEMTIAPTNVTRDRPRRPRCAKPVG